MSEDSGVDGEGEREQAVTEEDDIGDNEGTVN